MPHTHTHTHTCNCYCLCVCVCASAAAASFACNTLRIIAVSTQVAVASQPHTPHTDTHTHTLAQAHTHTGTHSHTCARIMSFRISVASSFVGTNCARVGGSFPLSLYLSLSLPLSRIPTVPTLCHAVQGYCSHFPSRCCWHFATSTA